MKKLMTYAAVSLVLTSACLAQTPAKPANAAQAEPVASADPHVKFKDGERYLRDLSTSLSIPRDEICRELGRYDCVTEAFRIVLGGVQAPDLSVNMPLEEAALTAPIALDRVAMHVCLARVKRDLAEPKKAVLVGPGAFGPRGGATKPAAAWLKATTANIYDTILLRSPTPAELTQMSAFYEDVRNGRKANDPAVASDWATLSCFAVASSLENTFY
jgi:hypothetical protein